MDDYKKYIFKTLLLVFVFFYFFYFADERDIPELDAKYKQDGIVLFDLETFYDAPMDWTAELNYYFNTHPDRAESCTSYITLSYLVITIIIIFMWILGEDWIALAITLGWCLKQSASMLFSMPTPPGLIWSEKLLASLFFDWHRKTGYFFASHIMFTVIMLSYIIQKWPHWITNVSASVFLILTILWTTIFRINYTSDVICGFFVGMFVYGIVPSIKRMTLYVLFSGRDKRKNKKIIK